MKDVSRQNVRPICASRHGGKTSAADRTGITIGGCDDAYNLEFVRQAREGKAGLYLVLVNSWRHSFFSIVILEFVIAHLHVALYYQ